MDSTRPITDQCPIRVGIDCRSLQRGPSGISTYVRNLREQIPFLDCVACSVPRNNFLWNQLCVPPAQLIRRWNVYHAPAYTSPLLNFCPLVLMVHDISYLVRKEWYPYQLDSLRQYFYISSLKRADRIIVPSDYSGGELIRLFPDLENRVRRIHQGVSSFFKKDEIQAEKARQELGLPKTFLLHVGDVHPRRNLLKLVAAAKRVKLPLVLVGRILRGGERLAGAPFLYSGLSDQQLKGIYSAATVFVYPSLYEGFGLPVLEAMACGLPVVASKRSCLPEVCADAAYLVQPEVDRLVEGISEVISNRGEYVRRGLARAREFTWEKTAAETIKVYEELM